MKIMEIRLVLIPLLGALTLALSIAGAESNDDAHTVDSRVSDESNVGKPKEGIPIVWEQDIPGLDLATETPVALPAEKQTEKTASTPKPTSEI